MEAGVASRAAAARDAVVAGDAPAPHGDAVRSAAAVDAAAAPPSASASTSRDGWPRR